MQFYPHETVGVVSEPETGDHQITRFILQLQKGLPSSNYSRTENETECKIFIKEVYNVETG